MMSFFVAPESRTNDATEEFGHMWHPDDWHNGSLRALNYPGIGSGSRLTVLLKPLSGLLNQNKMLPIRYCPITIELELVDTPSEPVLSVPVFTNQNGDSAIDTEYSTSLIAFTPLNFDQLANR